MGTVVVRHPGQSGVAPARQQANPAFSGAAVLEPQTRVGLLGVEALHIIDGQQRLTTLQYVLAALAISLRQNQVPGLLSLVESCLSNANIETMERPEVEIFKVWPTFRDRETFKLAIAANSLKELRDSFPASFTQNETLRKVGVHHPPALEAIWYFNERLRDWISHEGDSQCAPRSNAITEAVLRDLNIVSISLSEEDDAQVIFETLNGHGAELHATDLIRNFIFMRADREGAAAAELYDSLWTPFETDFWMEQQRRGRLKKPRLEWFMQTSLQAELGEEIDVGRLYFGYRRFALDRPQVVSAADQLRVLNLYSEHYKQLITGVGETPIAKFGNRTCVWDASTTHALALSIAKSSAPPHDQAAMFDAIASYLVRRAVCGLTTKSYNRIFAQQLKQLAGSGLTFDALQSSLAKLDGDASRWPRDDEFRKFWLEARIYPGNLDPARTKSMLAELEEGMRSAKTEEPHLLAVAALDIDHILPTSWFEHWPLPDGAQTTATEAQALSSTFFSDQPLSERHAAIRRREMAKTRFGNLTLLHYGVNRGLQNHGFTKKREAFFAHSNLHLNRQLMVMSAWNEDEIDRRGRDMFDVATQVWRGPKT